MKLLISIDDAPSPGDVVFLLPSPAPIGPLPLIVVSPRRLRVPARPGPIPLIVAPPFMGTSTIVSHASAGSPVGFDDEALYVRCWTPFSPLQHTEYAGSWGYSSVSYPLERLRRGVWSFVGPVCVEQRIGDADYAGKPAPLGWPVSEIIQASAITDTSPKGNDNDESHQRRIFRAMVR